jgi:hypothetical protein
VRVIEGPFFDFEAIFEKYLSGTKHVAILLDKGVTPSAWSSTRQPSQDKFDSQLANVSGTAPQ